MRAWRASLSAKILAGTALTVLLTTLLSGVYLAGLQQASLDASFDRQSQTIARTIAAFSIEPLLTMDYPVLEHALAGVGRADDSILYIEIMHRGTVVATYGDAQAKGRAFSEAIRMHEAISAKIGDVYLLVSTQQHEIFIADSLRKIAGATLLVFTAFGVALVWLLRRTVIAPIEVLTRQTEQTIARALPSTQGGILDSPRQDEIQVLGERFMTMLVTLEQRELARREVEAELLEHKNNLERLVRQRTQAFLQAQQEADRLNQAKSEFLTAASHDLRQPIQAISLFQNALEMSGLTAEQSSLNRSIGQGVAALNDILGTLLDISKLDSGVVKPQRQRLEVESLVERVDQSFGEIARQRGLRFKLWFPLRGLSLRTDPGLLFVLLRNLIDNALKYTEQGGVLVSFRRHQNMALIQIWDTGIGISAADRQAIFEEYVQVGNPERDKAKGLGLGLSIVRRIAGLMGTEVNCRSRPGRGSVFSLTIPLWTPPASPGTAPEKLVPDAPGFDFSRRQVVLIEDDPLVAEALSLALRGRGMEVRRFLSGDAALASDAVERADYLISDYRLPGNLNGIDLLARLLQRSKRPLRCVMVSGDPLVVLPQTLSERGVVLLHKPVDLARLLAVFAGMEK